MNNNVYFLSHNESQLYHLHVRRTENKGYVIDMPDGTEYKIDVNPENHEALEDYRFLVIVDGDIPTGGLCGGVIQGEVPFTIPPSGRCPEVIQSEVLTGRFAVPVDSAYIKRAKSEEEPTHVRWRSRVHQIIRRHAILFSLDTSMLLRRYEPSTLQPCYITIVLEKGKGFSIRPIFSR